VLSWSWKIGEVAGIAVRVHGTLLLLLAWVVLGHVYYGHGALAALAGLALVALVFAIIVLHELGHALVARRFGCTTRDITLLPIGGVASLDRMPSEPGQELLVALAGPAVNAVLALILGAVLAVGGGGEGGLGLVAAASPGGALLVQLLWINVALAGFNLIPAFPMDGGRAMRALLAMRLDYDRATAIAARIGKILAWVMGAVGLWLSPLLVLIAVFVWLGAHQESAVVHVRSQLAGVPVRRAMLTQIDTLTADQPLEDAIERILSGGQEAFPVVDGDRVVGVLGRADVAAAVARGRRGAPVSAAMRTEVLAVQATDTLDHALEALQAAASPTALVVDGDGLVGMLTAEHIASFLAMQGPRAGSGATMGRRIWA